jgi:hypothetical protein
VTLAVAHGHAAPPFNGLFYATVATIIPVLFVALAAGRPYEGLLRTALLIARAREAGESPFRPALSMASRIARRLPPRRIPRIMLINAFVIMTAGVVGEGISIAVLYQRSDDAASRATAFTAAIILLIAVATGPVQAYIMASLSMPGGPLDHQAEHAAGAQQRAAGAQAASPASHEAGADPAVPAPSEPGKQDAS